MSCKKRSSGSKVSTWSGQVTVGSQSWSGSDRLCSADGGRILRAAAAQLYWAASEQMERVSCRREGWRRWRHGGGSLCSETPPQLHRHKSLPPPLTRVTLSCELRLCAASVVARLSGISSRVPPTRGAALLAERSQLHPVFSERNSLKVKEPASHWRHQQLWMWWSQSTDGGKTERGCDDVTEVWRLIVCCSHQESKSAFYTSDNVCSDSKPGSLWTRASRRSARLSDSFQSRQTVELHHHVTLRSKKTFHRLHDHVSIKHQSKWTGPRKM